MSNDSSLRSSRLVSLDALRGFDMFWIMSGDQIIHQLAKATGWPVLVWMSDQLHHTVWNGFTFYDMIFPLFLFIAGVSMPFSLQKKVQQAGVGAVELLPVTEKRKIYLSMLRRTITLILLGMVVNGLLKFDGLEHTRFPSVLGRIGLAWFFAGLIYLNTNIRGQIIWLAGLLLGYWALMMWVPVPGYGAGVLTMEGSFESYIDRLLIPGKLHDKVHDPEGVLSTIPAIGTALLGMLTGTFLHRQQPGMSMQKKTLWLVVGGVVLIILGLLWNTVFPINKRLWSSSFVLYVGGLSLLLFALFYYVIDVLGWKRWAFPFVIIGMNSIVIYMAAEGVIDFAYIGNYIFGGLIHLAPVLWQPVLAVVSVTLVQLGLLYFLYRNKLFLKV
jgi:predicted acyltransferase